MLSPIAFLIEHRKIILTQYRQNAGQPKKTWESLLKILPQLSESMRFNTFKQYMSVFVAVTNGLDKVIQERDELIHSRDNLLKDLKITTKQKTQLEGQVDELKTGLDKVIQDRDEVTQSRQNLLIELKITTKQRAQLEDHVDELKSRLDKVTQTQVVDTSIVKGLDKKPKRISGWNVQKSKDGYYRCYRKIAKRLYCIYLGKELDLKKSSSSNYRKRKNNKVIVVNCHCSTVMASASNLKAMNITRAIKRDHDLIKQWRS